MPQIPHTLLRPLPSQKNFRAITRVPHTLRLYEYFNGKMIAEATFDTIRPRPHRNRTTIPHFLRRLADEEGIPRRKTGIFPDPVTHSHPISFRIRGSDNVPSWALFYVRDG